ncbi:hypothetical protein [Haliangium ochraceum]|uniref:Uncharacterized protein n=1 Tax=Haliangium ochraceum (strain DSM 14365 / JCM 11303 / SMP-2) TaxID=502025 RepID=D0LV36_HALO1|nr:hypothetical protein [Haliangium ochraceum]ACY15877.1 hypothetical protein Hoch_3375 [Haliangium ochraceum DSM 14365]
MPLGHFRKRTHLSAGPARAQASTLGLAALGAALALLPAGCEDPVNPPTVFTLDGPSRVAFSCYGQLRLTGGQAASADQAVVNAPMPASACYQWNQVRLEPPATEDDEDDEDGPEPPELLTALPPAGQGPLIDLEVGAELSAEAESELLAWQSEVALYGFALQPNEGTVAVIREMLGEAGIRAGSDGLASTADFSLLDADTFSPGVNAIAVGAQPVDIAADPDGCYVYTANAGSCDLSVLDVPSALAPEVLPTVQRLRVLGADGGQLLAKPAALVAPGRATQGTAEEAAEGEAQRLGLECPSAPGGVVFVAYPNCHAVGAVDLSSGEILASVVFDEAGVPVVSAGAFDCAAATCGGPSSPPDVVAPDAGVPDASPDAGIEPDAGAGAQMAPAEFTIAAIGDRPQPTALHMADDGRRLYIGAANSPQVTVVELDEAFTPVEAFSVALAGEVGVTALSASSLIAMGGDQGRADEGVFGDFRFVYAVATDNTVRVVEVHEQRRECDTQIDPRYLYDVRDGALLACLPVGDPSLPRRASARSPGVHFPRSARPLDVAISRVQVESTVEGEPPVRSAANLVGHFAFVTLSDGSMVIVNIDDDNYPDVEDLSDPSAVALSLALPHQLRDGDLAQRNAAVDDCAFPGGSGVGTVGMTAPPAASRDTTVIAEEREDVLPELRALECVPTAEDAEPVSVGVPDLSPMASPAQREAAFPDLRGVVTETWNMEWEGRIPQPSAGILPITVHVGYIEANGDGVDLRDGASSFCGIGVAPGDTVTMLGCDSGESSPACEAGGACAELVGARYRVTEVDAERMALRRRYRTLRTTPLSGCESAAQCSALHDWERSALPALTDDGTGDPCADPEAAAAPECQRSFSCEPVSDPARAECVMTCDSDSDCDIGWSCSSLGYCVDDPLPPAECADVLLRYELRVGGAFAVIGASSGFLHHRVRDPDTGVCVDDPEGNPLLVGRLPLSAPPCEGDGPAELTPNPCAVEVEHFEDGSVRPAQAIRFRNPSFVTHLVDPVVDFAASESVACPVDEPACAEIPAVFPDYRINFNVGGGFSSQAVVSGMIYPVGLRLGPLGDLWVLDEGDNRSEGNRGQVNRIELGPPYPVIGVR